MKLFVPGTNFRQTTGNFRASQVLNALKLRRRVVRNVLVVLLLTAASGVFATAQIPTAGNVFLGYSYMRADTANLASLAGLFAQSDKSNLNGWNASLEGKFLPYIGLVADIDGTYGTQNFTVNCEAIPSPPCTPVAGSADTKLYTFLFGPRVSFSIGRVRPFAEAMFGAGHVTLDTNLSGGSTSDTSFATAVGGGVDFKLIPAVAWRFEGDYVQTRFFSDTQNNFRFSTGLVIHF